MVTARHPLPLLPREGFKSAYITTTRVAKVIQLSDEAYTRLTAPEGRE